MKIEDRALVEKFVEKAKGLEKLVGMVLFGSMARGEEERHSDIDILLIFDKERAESMLEEVVRLTTELKGHREVKPVLTNLRDLDPSFLCNVFREGEVLWIKGEALLPLLTHEPCRLVSYDLSGLESSKRTKISRRIHGYTSVKKVRGKKKEYIYHGIGDVLGPTVLVQEEKFPCVRKLFESTGVRYRVKKVWI
jgi:predicted nucleotidyltransferase